MLADVWRRRSSCCGVKTLARPPLTLLFRTLAAILRPMTPPRARSWVMTAMATAIVDVSREEPRESADLGILTLILSLYDIRSEHHYAPYVQPDPNPEDDLEAVGSGRYVDSDCRE